MPQQAQKAVQQLDEVLHCIAKQNAWLRALALAMTVVLAGGTVGAIVVSVKLGDLREEDMRHVERGRATTRLVAADNGLRACRSDEQQDRVLARLLRVSLTSPPRRDLTRKQEIAQAKIRAEFARTITAFEEGRSCEQIEALLLVSERVRAALVKRYPKVVVAE